MNNQWDSIMLKKVISGGQTGVDQAALWAAFRVGLETGGWAPLGWITESGPMPMFLRGFGLKECPIRHSAIYPPRTRANARDSDGTVFIRWGSPSRGETLTREACNEFGKPFHLIHAAPYWTRETHENAHRLLGFIRDHKIEVLNVAGNRESRSPGIGIWAEGFLEHHFSLENQ